MRRRDDEASVPASIRGGRRNEHFEAVDFHPNPELNLFSVNGVSSAQAARPFDCSRPAEPHLMRIELLATFGCASDLFPRRERLEVVDRRSKQKRGETLPAAMQGYRLPSHLYSGSADKCRVSADEVMVGG